MKRQEKADAIAKILESLYPDPEIPLRHESDYQFLICVLLSAQSTDKKVNEISPLLFAKAATPEEMITLDVDVIREIIRPIGLSPRKSKAISQLSHILLDKHGGEVPDNYKDLEALPAVGHKTASVVMSQAFGHPAFPVDTHIHRLMYLWGLSTGRSVEQTERDAKRLFPEALWNKLHLQIIFYGREYSPARAWDIEKDIITAKIGRATELKKFA